MKLTKRVLLYITTVVVIIGVVFWNSWINDWLTTQDQPEMVVRTDLLVIYPLVITLVVLSAYHLYKDWKHRKT